MAYDYYQDYNQGYYGDTYGGNEWDYEDAPQQDTESQKLRKEQEMIEAIESNRLYLRKVRKRCVQEDFADLEKTQMFLFEFLVESMEVNAKSELGLVPESEADEPFELVARVQFLNNPYLEIREKGEKMERNASVIGETEYFEAVGNAGLNNAVNPGKTVGVRSPSVRENESEQQEGSVKAAPADTFNTKWEISSGKSLLFSKSALEIIQGLDKSPIKVQVSRCVETKEEEREVEDDEEGIDSGFDDEIEVKKERKGICEPIGYALVRLPDHFSLSVLQSCKPGVILPVSCVHRDTCELKNVFGVKKGQMQVFIRLSCFGQVITTSFQSVGPERRYVFKPSPQPIVEGPEDSEVNRDTVLKPIVAEEGVAIGITIVKDEDIFQKSVLWKSNQPNCGCLDKASVTDEFESPHLSYPRPSDNALCRGDVPSKQAGKPFCGWHNLVSKEIKNSPGGNCGCLDGVNVIKSPEPLTEKSPTFKSQFSLTEPSSEKIVHNKPSRIEKMLLKSSEKPSESKEKVAEKVLKPVVGVGIHPEPVDCNCDCGRIRNSIEMKPMMKYTWQPK